MMKLIVWIFFVLTAINHAHTAFAPPILPNIQDMTLGFDSSIMQPTLISLRYPVFNAVYNDTVTMSNKKFRIPNGCQCLETPIIAKTSKNEIFVSEEDIQTSIYESISLSENFIFGMCSQSYQSKYFNNEFNLYASYTALSNLVVENWKCNCHQTNFTDVFRNTLNSLPKVYNSTTCPTFKSFFNQYGTHYIITIVFGGTVQMQTSFTIQYYKSTTTEQISADLNAQLFLKISTNLTESQEQTLQQLDAIYDSTIALIGGFPSNFTITQWQQWAKTTYENPSPLQVGLSPYYNITQNMGLYNATVAYLQSNINNWKSLGNIPSNIYYPYIPVPALTTIIGNQMYIYSCLVMYNYNAKQNTWTPLPALTNQIIGVGFTSYTFSNNVSYLYTFGGDYPTGPAYTSQSWQYNTQTNVWNPIASMPWEICYVSAITVNNLIYTIGGLNYYNSPSPVWLYNPNTNAWSQLATMLTYRMSIMTIALNNKIYAIGGMSASPAQSVPVNNVEVYDIATNTWQILSSLPTGLWAGMVYAQGNNIYVIGGSTSFSMSTPAVSSNVYIFNTMTNTWKTEALNQQYQMWNPAGGVINNKELYMFGAAERNINPNIGFVKLLTEFC